MATKSGSLPAPADVHPIRKLCCFTARAGQGSLRSWPPSPWPPSAICRSLIRSGVAVPVLAIAEDESRAYDYTTMGNFVAVITNGTAILGLGIRGALAAKPVMEGKSVLFKRFADVDSDRPRSLDRRSRRIPYRLRLLLGKSWGGINLEDIKALNMLHHRAEAARTARRAFRSSMTISTAPPSSLRPA